MGARDQLIDIGQLRGLGRRATESRRKQLEARNERAVAIVRAVRAGARLEEIGTAAGITKAAASAIARRTLPPRTGSGGPYGRRRGVAHALESVTESAERLRRTSADAQEAILRRDRAILRAAGGGLDVRVIAELVGMRTSVVYQLLRRRRHQATEQCDGTLAS